MDAGASTSFIDKRWVEERKLSITPRKGHIVQVTNGGQQPRIGVVEGLTLENGTRVIKVDLEVAELSGEEELIIGIDLFKPLGFELQNIPYMWPTRPDQQPKEKNTSVHLTNAEEVNYPEGIENGIAEE